MVDLCLLGCGGGMPMPFRSLSASLLNFKGRKTKGNSGNGIRVKGSEYCGGCDSKKAGRKQKNFPKRAPAPHFRKKKIILQNIFVEIITKSVSSKTYLGI